MRLDVAGRSDVGTVRSLNEDRYAIRRDSVNDGDGGVLCILADGMGGYASGDLAATMAVEMVLQGTEEGVALPEAVATANAEIYRRSLAEATHRGMGTTITCVHIGNGQAEFVHAGDSRMYLIRDGKARQLTSDHSWVADEVRAGRLTAEEARRSKHRNLITRALGLEQQMAADTGTCLLIAGDALLLCSDGVHNLVSDGELVRACEQSAEVGSNALVEAVITRGAPDNATVVIARVLSDGAEPPREVATRPLPVLGGVTESNETTGSAASPRMRRARPITKIVSLCLAVLALAIILYIALVHGVYQGAGAAETRANLLRPIGPSHPSIVAKMSYNLPNTNPD
jgi:serine/threonine protein phosphatase PrpC